MFDRFTEEAKTAMSLSRRAAQRFGHDYIGTEHILLGVIAEESAATQVLRRLCVPLEQIAAAVERVVEPTPGQNLLGQLAFTPQSKMVLEEALAAAVAADHDWIGSQHLLVGLVREQCGIAATVLESLNVRADAVFADITRRWPGRCAKPMGPIVARGVQETLAGAVSAAHAAGDDEVGIGHVVLRSLEDHPGFWSAVCTRCGVDPADLTRAIEAAHRGGDASSSGS